MRDISDGSILISIVADACDLAGFDELKDKILSIEMKQYRNKRSGEANRYYWELLQDLAHYNRVSKVEMHNMLLERYGYLDFIDGQLIELWFDDNTEVYKFPNLHLRATSTYMYASDPYDNGRMMHKYYKLRGSSEYNSLEMADLIDGLVSECKEAGIETITPDELARLKEAMRNNV